MLTSSQRLFLLTLACGAGASSAIACGRVERDDDLPNTSGGGPGAGGSSGLAGATGGSSTAPECVEEVGSCPATVTGAWRVLLDARDFGGGARLVEIGGRAVLVDTGESGFQVVDVLSQEEQLATGEAYVVWPVPPLEARPVDVTETTVHEDGNAYRSVVVLACRETNTGCSLLRSDESTRALVAWPDSELPDGLVASGILFDTALDEPRVCVYGNGLVCWGDGWEHEIPVIADLRLNHVSISSLWSLAVGEQGRWYRRERDNNGVLSAWEAQPPLEGASLSYASGTDLGGVIVGDGSIQAALGVQTEHYRCAIPRDLEALVLNPWLAGYAQLLTQTGEVLLRSSMVGAPYCTFQQLPVGVVRGLDTAPCQQSVNPRVLLDEAQLVGQNLCLELL